MIAIAFYNSWKKVVTVLLLIPFFEIKNIIFKDRFYEEIAIIISLGLTAGLFLLFKKKLISDSISGIEKKTYELSSSEIIPFNDEKRISYCLQSMFRIDEECRDILIVTKKILCADSVSLFVGSDSGLRLRCSTEESGRIIPSDNGIINRCFNQKESFLLIDINEKNIHPGYLREDKISSLIAVPVIDGDFTLGVIAADSARFQAFNPSDREVLETFSQHITRILQKERLYPHIQRSYDALKTLHEESSKLLSTLNMDEIAEHLIEGAKKIVSADILFFVAKGSEFEIIHRTNIPIDKDRKISLKNTLLDMAIKNKQAINVSNVRDYRSPILPFKIDNVRSVFILPLFYENDLIGILVLLSKEASAFNPYQIELLEVLGNQASTSMANARFHAEIERIAITDGLTGLYNHRYFQEKLSEEFNRVERYSNPLSLLLIDIDYFKKINDTYGHPVGDAVLKKIASIIRKTIRNIDIPARYGGEEFALILPGTDSQGAKNMAERLRKAIMDISFFADKERFKVTVSIGISTNPKPKGTGEVKNKEELIEKADKALYEAKKAGRNRSIFLLV